VKGEKTIKLDLKEKYKPNKEIFAVSSRSVSSRCRATGNARRSGRVRKERIFHGYRYFASHQLL
jgi:hypothetical protein